MVKSSGYHGLESDSTARMEDIRNHVKQGTDKLARCVGHLKVSTRLVFEQVLSGRVLCRASIFPSGHGSSQWNTLLNPHLVLLGTSENVHPKYAASPASPASARLDLYGPVMDLSDVHHAAMRPWGSLWTAIAAAQHQPVHNRSLKVTSDVRN